jgi:hypothetical protein
MTGPRVIPGVTHARNEKELTRDVRKLAADRDWLRYHTHRSDFSPAGFPDECLVRPPRLVFAELKGPKGKESPLQELWRTTLGRVPGVEAYLWFPTDWDDIIRILW